MLEWSSLHHSVAHYYSTTKMIKKDVRMHTIIGSVRSMGELITLVIRVIPALLHIYMQQLSYSFSAMNILSSWKAGMIVRISQALLICGKIVIKALGMHQNELTFLPCLSCAC